MCPLGTTICLLVVLMFMPHSAAARKPFHKHLNHAGYVEEMCKTKHPVVKCRKDVGGGTWYQLDWHRCVKAFYHTQHLTYWDAEAECKKYRHTGFEGHLVSIHNKDQEEKVICAMYRETTGKAHYWIGLYLAKCTQDGLHCVVTYKWTDGSKMVFSKWHHGQPDFFKRIEECIEMNYWNWGSWNDLNCGTPRPYVCAVRIG